jgi:cation diffusion facilitator family transporter
MKSSPSGSHRSSGSANLTPVNQAGQRGLEIRRVLVVTLLLNLLVAVLKLVYGTLTHTLSLRADGFHSLTDSFNNLLGLAGVWWSLRPPDSKHPYGHDKMEVVAASAVGASLILMAWDIVRGAASRWSGESPKPDQQWGTVAVLVLTLAINLGVTHYEKRKAKALSSAFLASDASHTQSDVLVTLGVLLTVGFLELGYLWMDWVAACGIGVFILVTGLRVLSRNLDYLMDSAQVEEKTIHDVVCRVSGVAGAHKIRTRGSPGAIRVDLHIQIARHLNVVHAHEVTHWAIDALKREVDGVYDVVVHTEPASEGATYPELPPRMLL